MDWTEILGLGRAKMEGYHTQLSLSEMWDRHLLSRYITQNYNEQNQADRSPQDRFSRLSLASLFYFCVHCDLKKYVSRIHETPHVRP
jgi:hypothetical protein